MDNYDIIAGSFQSTIEALAMSVDEIAEELSLGSEQLVSTLLAEGRILAAGAGPDQPLAEFFATSMMQGSGRERPALPAIALPLGADVSGSDADELLARQLRALGQPNDVLLLIADDAAAYSGSLAAAVERQMAVTCLCRFDTGGQALATGHNAIALPRSNPRNRAALTTMVLTSLVELVETALFGPE